MVRLLEPPLTEVEDRVMFIPRGQELLVEKDEPRVVLVCDGRMRLQVDCGSPTEIGPGDIVVLTGPCRQIYQPILNRAISRLHVFRIVFDKSQLSFDPSTGWPLSLAPKYAESDFTVFIQNHFGRLAHLPRGQNPTIQALMDAIRQDAQGETLGFRHRVSARARLLITLIGEQIASRGTPKPRRDPASRRLWISEQIKEYLLTKSADPVTLDDVARHLRMSGEHLARAFKDEESKTIFEYLRDLRLERAKALLISAPLTINEIARQIGYSSATLFCRNFKRATGITPMSYRERGGGQRSFSASRIRGVDRREFLRNG